MVPEICVALLMSVFPATSTVWADEPLAPCTSAVVEGADCSGSVRQPAILRLNHFGGLPCEEQVLAANGFKRVGRHSEYAI